jgi:hypothetical protein
MIIQKPSPNQDANRVKVDRVVIHWIVGNLAAADAVFAKPGGVSAHYGIEDNTVHQYVAEDKVAYHAGVYAMNQRSIGIEHSAAPDRPASEATYQTSGKLIAEICKRHSIPLDRAHIIKHSEVKATQCPGTMDLDKLINIAKNQGATGDNVVRKSSFFDITWMAFKGNVDTDKVTKADLDAFIAWVKTNIERAGKWDTIVNIAFGSADSNLKKPEDVRTQLEKEDTELKGRLSIAEGRLSQIKAIING